MTLPIMVDGIAADVATIKASRFANHPAQAYVTGGWPVEWTDGQILSFARHIRTAQQPWAAVDEATLARELDVESGAATPADWPVFFGSRTNKRVATVYCDISNVPRVAQACSAANLPLDVFRWRIAWWWRNQVGVPLPDDVDVPYPPLEQVVSEVARLTGIDLDPRAVWACQFANYRAWDLSVVYGKPDFART